MTQARLPGTARGVLAEIFRAIPVGTWRHISHKTLSRRLRHSESSISRAMALLAAEARDADGDLINKTPFIARRPRADGPGYEICPLPPPELRRAPKPADSPIETPPEASRSPSINDPGRSIPPQGVPTPQNGIDGGSNMDAPIFLDHACSSGSMRDLPQQNAPPAEPEADRVGGLPPVLDALGLLPHQWRNLREIRPDLSVAACTEALEKLRTRADVRSAFAVLKEALERGEPVYSQAEVDAHLAALRALSRPPDEQASNPPEAADGKKRNRGRAALEAPPDERSVQWLLEQGIAVSVGGKRLLPPGEEDAPTTPHRPPAPYYGPEPTPERAVGDPPPISPRPLIDRPPPGVKRLGPLHELGRARQVENLKRGRR